MSEHKGFTVEEATTTEAGRIRGVILDTIASRVGQVPDLHPRLLEGIEVAARRLAAVEVTPLPHHVVLKNGRDDIVCACGEHFRMRVIDASKSYQPTDAIAQWVAHYREAES